MKIVTIDFETYYDQEYSLAKMTTQEYLFDDRFEVIYMGMKLNDGPTSIYTADQIEEELAKIDWKRATLVCHNTMFDGSILAWKYGIHPAKYFCTMMGSRPDISPFIGGKMALSKVVSYLDLGQKGQEVYNAKGLRYADMGADFRREYKEYCKTDVDLTYKAYLCMRDDLPEDEKEMIDLTLRKFIEPVLELDADVLDEALAYEKLAKEAVLADAGLKSRDILMSNQKFADALENLGVVPPTKISPRTGLVTYAFAKTDRGMAELLRHDNPQVRLLCEARVKHKSTIEETRLARFRKLADLGKFAIPLLYYGAHTGRFSGFDKLNLQNMGRKSKLRAAVKAPDGMSLVVGDLSQIEARVTAMLAGQKDLLQAFIWADEDSSRPDVYMQFAGEKLYGVGPAEVSDAQRFIGKMCILGLGFGMGAEKFKESVRAIGDVDITDMEAQRTVRTYRTAYPMITKLWRTAGDAIEVIINGGETKIGPCTVVKGKVILPNGMKIYYPDAYRDASGEVWYNYQGKPKKLYGGIVVENIVQALARIILVAAELRLAKYGYRAALSVHDELIYCAPDHKATKFKQALHAALTAPVPWMFGLPLEAECSVAKLYSEAK